MKTIVFNNRTFSYIVLHVLSADSNVETIFYEGEETYTEREYVFFGKKITKVRPKEVFKIYANANNPEISKEWWNKSIGAKVAISDRQEELNKGILI